MHFKTTVSAFLMLLISGTGRSQHKREKDGCTGIKDTLTHKLVYTQYDKPPEPLIGFAKLNVAVAKGIRFSKKYQELQGRVFVAFVVEKNGHVDGGRTVRNIANEDHFFSDQVIRIIKQYRWKPGLCNGKPVPVLFTMPFRIHTEE